MKTINTQSEQEKLAQNNSEPVNEEFVQDNENMDRDTTSEDIHEGNSVHAFKLVYDEVDPI